MTAGPPRLVHLKPPHPDRLSRHVTDGRPFSPPFLPVGDGRSTSRLHRRPKDSQSPATPSHRPKKSMTITPPNTNHSPSYHPPTRLPNAPPHPTAAASTAPLAHTRPPLFCVLCALSRPSPNPGNRVTRPSTPPLLNSIPSNPSNTPAIPPPTAPPPTAPASSPATHQFAAVQSPTSPPSFSKNADPACSPTPDPATSASIPPPTSGKLSFDFLLAFPNFVVYNNPRRRPASTHARRQVSYGPWQNGQNPLPKWAEGILSNHCSASNQRMRYYGRRSFAGFRQRTPRRRVRW